MNIIDLGIPEIDKFDIDEINESCETEFCIGSAVRKLEQQNREMIKRLIERVASDWECVPRNVNYKLPMWKHLQDDIKFIESIDPQHRKFEEIRELVK